MNIIERLTVKIGNQTYKVSIDKSDTIVESEMCCFIGKRSSDLFRWLRCRKAKIYNSDSIHSQ